MSIATRSPEQSSRYKGPQDPVLAIGKVATWVAVSVCLLPLPLVFVAATSTNWAQGPWAGGFTFEWLTTGWSMIAGNAWYSVQVATVVLLVNFLIGLPASWIIARRKFPGRGILMAITQMPIAIPGVALALGLVLSYPELRPSGLLLIGGHVLYTLPFLVATIVPALANRETKEKELVASTLGAGPLMRFMRVTLPSCRHALLAGTILVVTLSLGEFNVSFFLFTPVEQPLPVELYSSYITNRVEIAAASTLWFLMFVVPAALVAERFGGAKAGSA